MMDEIKIQVYQTPQGKEPFTDWVRKLPFQDRQIVRKRLARVRLGNLGDAKKIIGSKQIYELRIHFGPGYRIYFIQVKENLALQGRVI